MYSMYIVYITTYLFIYLLHFFIFNLKKSKPKTKSPINQKTHLEFYFLDFYLVFQWISFFF